MYKHFKKIGKNNSISSWKPKGLSNEVIKPHAINNSLVPTLGYDGKAMYVEFSESCLIKQNKFTFDNKKIVNIYLVYDLQSNLNNFDFALEKCLFGVVKLAKNSEIDKYKYSGYGIRFDARGTFSFSGGSFAQNTVIFSADMSSSVLANNGTKSILVLDQGITQGLDDTTLTAEKLYQVNFSATKKKILQKRVYTIMELIVIYQLTV